MFPHLKTILLSKSSLTPWQELHNSKMLLAAKCFSVVAAGVAVALRFAVCGNDCGLKGQSACRSTSWRLTGNTGNTDNNNNNNKFTPVARDKLRAVNLSWLWKSGSIVLYVASSGADLLRTGAKHARRGGQAVGEGGSGAPAPNAGCVLSVETEAIILFDLFRHCVLLAKSSYLLASPLSPLACGCVTLCFV